MKRLLLSVAIAIVPIAGCERTARTCDCDVEVPIMTGEQSVPAVAIYRVPAGNRVRTAPEESEPPIIVAVWPDGRIVWSEDSTRGGRPYLVGRISPRSLDAFFESLRAQSVSADALSGRSWLGPDSDYLAIVLCGGGYCLRLESWHELFETRGNLVATAHGIQTLGERSRPEVLAEQPEEYRRFREAWTQIRDASGKLIPSEGKSAEQLHFERKVDHAS